MNPIELKALQRARVNFLENLDVDHVKDHLIQYDVLSVDDKEDILTERTRRKRVELLLDRYLPRPRCQDAFAKLCQTLTETGYDFLRDNLVDELEKLKTDPTRGDWLLAMSPAARRRRVSEVELTQIAQNLGSEWLLLGEVLGQHRARLQQLQMQHPYSVPAQIQAMLTDWSRTKTSEATVENLVAAFRKCNIDEQQFRAIIEEASAPQSTPFLV